MRNKKFSERIYAMVMDLVSSAGAKSVTAALGLQDNYFSPSKYSQERFGGKAIDHLDSIEEYFGVDLLGGADSALAKEVQKAEAAGVLSQHDREAIRSVIRSAREHSGLRGAAAVARIRKSRGPGK